MRTEGEESLLFQVQRVPHTVLRGDLPALSLAAAKSTTIEELAPVWTAGTATATAGNGEVRGPVQKSGGNSRRIVDLEEEAEEEERRAEERRLLSLDKHHYLGAAGGSSRVSVHDIKRSFGIMFSYCV